MSSFTRRPKEGVSSGYAAKQLSHPSKPPSEFRQPTAHNNCKGVSSFSRTYCAEELGGLQCGDAKAPSTWFRDMPMSNSLSPRFVSQHLPCTLQTINVPLISMLASVRHPHLMIDTMASVFHIYASTTALASFLAMLPECALNTRVTCLRAKWAHGLSTPVAIHSGSIHTPVPPHVLSWPVGAPSGCTCAFGIWGAARRADREPRSSHCTAVTRCLYSPQQHQHSRLGTSK